MNQYDRIYTILREGERIDEIAPIIAVPLSWAARKLALRGILGRGILGRGAAALGRGAAGLGRGVAGLGRGVVGATQAAGIAAADAAGATAVGLYAVGSKKKATKIIKNKPQVVSNPASEVKT